MSACQAVHLEEGTGEEVGEAEEHSSMSGCLRIGGDT